MVLTLILILTQYLLEYHKADRVYYITVLVLLSYFSLMVLTLCKEWYSALSFEEEITSSNFKEESYRA